MKQYDIIRFVSMTSLGSLAAPHCHTGQSKGRYHARSVSILIVVVGRAPLMDFKEIVGTYSVNRPTAAGNGHIQEEKPENELKC